MAKKDGFTIPLLFGFILTMVFQHFIDPLGDVAYFHTYWTTMVEKVFPSSGYQAFKELVFQILSILLPFLKCGVDQICHLIQSLAFVKGTSVAGEEILYAAITIIGYSFLLFFVEKLHRRINGTEKQLTVNLQMVFLDNIAVYCFSYILYLFNRLLAREIVIPNMIAAACAAFLILLSIRWVLTYLINLLIPLLMVIVLPMFVGWFISTAIHYYYPSVQFVGFCCMLIFSSIAWMIWRKKSDQFYEKCSQKLGFNLVTPKK